MPAITIEVTSRDSVLAELGRKATAALTNGEVDSAVDLLISQRVRAMHIRVRLSVQELLRLPLCLQRAGEFDHAMKEFERLLDGAATACSDVNATPARKAFDASTWRATVFDKMRVACRRQKETALADEYDAACQREREIADALREIVDEEWRLERERYAQRVKKREWSIE